jgi:hypothetical protein
MLKAFVLIVAIATAAFSTGCSVLDRIDTNPVIVRIAVTQGVLRYIEAGEDRADIATRKNNLVSVLTNTLTMIDSGEHVGVAVVFEHFVESIRLHDMSVSDRLLAIEVLRMVQHSLNERIGRGELPEATMLVLRDIVKTAIDAANYL